MAEYIRKEGEVTMIKINPEVYLKIAKELTTVALENKMIIADNDASVTAENVYEFYKTLFEKLSGETINS